MTLDGIAAVQTRMAEIRALVGAPATTTTSSSSSSEASFASALASATGTSVGGGTVAAGVVSSGSTTGQDLVAAAQKYLGVPYVWGGESLDEGGLDCSGLVLRSLTDLGVTGTPRTAREQMTLGTAVPSLDQALPGDLVVFGGGTHIGIYVGDGKMIDAPKPGASVTIRDVYTTPTAIRRILPQEPASGVSTAAASTLGASSTSSLQQLLAGLTSGGTTGTASVSSSQRAALELLLSGTGVAS